MKKLALLLLALAIVFIAVHPAPCRAYAQGAEFAFTLSCDKSMIKVGDVVTVTLTLTRTDSADGYQLYSAQDFIRFDNEVFELITPKGSISPTGFDCYTDQAGLVRLYRISMLTNGTAVANSMTVAVVQFRAVAAASAAAFANESYEVGSKTGMARYYSSANSINVSVEPDYSIQSVQTGGGAAVIVLTAAPAPGRIVAAAFYEQDGKFIGISYTAADGEKTEYSAAFSDMTRARRGNAFVLSNLDALYPAAPKCEFPIGGNLL